MTGEITGSVFVSKRLRRHSVWLREPFSYGQAWIDLMLLANDKPRTVTINGEPLHLKRGQVGWAIRTLEKEWNRSRQWVDSFLRFCVDEAMILVDSSKRRTVITILNYDVYQTDPQTVQRTDSHADPQSHQQTGHHQNGEQVNGKGEDRPPEIPSDEELGKFCATYEDNARGIPCIPEVWWTGWVAARLTAQKWPVDWRRALVLAFRSDWVARHPKAIGAFVKAASEKKARRERGEILQQLEIATDAEEISALKKELANA